MCELEEISNQQVILFPYMAAILTSGSLGVRQTRLNISIVIMDMVHPDLSNRIEVWSDTLQIINDLKAYLNDPAFDDYYILQEESQLTPFADRFTDNVTGWKMDLVFIINDLKDRCAIPQS